MASFFQMYFQTSSMPKRLLQYALSRIEILETEALNLEDLDIAWGRESIFEFKNVGLRIRKLETLLQLPSYLELSSANIRLLKVTIPVDIYNSSIRVEVEGVDSHLGVQNAKPHPDHERKRTTTARYKDNSQHHTKDHRTRTDHEREQSEHGGARLPSAADLAESFLQTEPEDNKAELKAALLSDNSELTASIMPSDDDENDSPLGTGAPLSVPAFMTRFLNGLIDRLQIAIHNITINLDIDLSNDNTTPHISSSPDVVTVQVQIEDVRVDGVTHVPVEHSEVESRHGKRCVKLSDVRGFLISEASLFSSLARSSELSSPSAAHSDLSLEKDIRITAPISPAVAREVENISSPDGDRMFTSLRGLSTLTAPDTSEHLGEVSKSMTGSDAGRFEDAPEDDHTFTLSSSLHTEDHELSDSVYGSSVLLSEVMDSRLLESMEDDVKDEADSIRSLPLRSAPNHATSAFSTPRASLHLKSTPENSPKIISFSNANSEIFQSQPAGLPTWSRQRFSSERVSDSQIPLMTQSTVAPADYKSKLESAQVAVSHYLGKERDGDDNVVNADEDLTRSQLFTHEDAESMYMSAISHASIRPKTSALRSDSSERRGELEPRSVRTILSNSRANAHVEPRSYMDQAQSKAAAKKLPGVEMTDAAEGFGMSDLPTSKSTSSSSSSFKQHQQPSPLPESSSDASSKSNLSSNDAPKLSKQILTIDLATIYIPGINSSKQPQTVRAVDTSVNENLALRQTALNIPGAFSTESAAQLPQISRYDSKSERLDYETKVGTPGDHQSVELQLDSLVCQFDVSVGKIFVLLAQVLKELIASDTQSSMNSMKDKSRFDTMFSIKARQISLQLLDRIQGTWTTMRLDDEEPGPPTKEVLLRTNLTDLHVETRWDELLSKTSISVGTFTFGYRNENILSFDRSLQLGSSVRDLQPSAGIDICVHVTQDANSTRLEVSTLPIHILFDLRKLDETLSWFGGLSSVLNLGNSIASNNTIIVSSPVKAKTRGVHFETAIRPDDVSARLQNKADIRIGGFMLDLVGTECSIGLETSAVKLVSRDEGVGVFIQRMRLSGPHFKHSYTEPAIFTEVTSTRIEYLTAPTDSDLDRLLALITPSKVKYDLDDDILIDTLLRQRKQGAVLRLTVADCQAFLQRIDELKHLPELGEEIARLGTVAKYLPEDDRPGLLSLIVFRKFDANVELANGLGNLQISSKDIEVAQITLPSLFAVSIGTLSAHRNRTEEIIGIATDPELREPRARIPSVMARMIGDEMEPIVRIKLWNLKVEYQVTTLVTLLELAKSYSPGDLSTRLAVSVATLTGGTGPPGSSKLFQGVPRSDIESAPSRAVAVDVVLRDCIVGLNPQGLSSKVLVVLSEARMNISLPKDGNVAATMELNRASILVIDDVNNIATSESRSPRRSFDAGSNQVTDLCALGYVTVSYISSARATVQVSETDGESSIDVELRDDLFVLESCADSTQTLIAVMSNLAPPTTPSKEIKYRTKVIPVQDLLASLSGDAFGTAEGAYNIDDDFVIDEGLEDLADNDVDFNFDSHYYQAGAEVLFDESDLGVEERSASRLTTRDTLDGVLLESLVEPSTTLESEGLEFQEDHFGTGSVLEGTAHRWNSARNTYDQSNASKIRDSPLKVCIRDVHIIWNLFDGYDWQNTRDKITKAVHEVESKAIEKRSWNERRPTFDQDVENGETMIGDFLFNSIYIGIPANRDPRELTAAINQELNDNVTETESIATTISASPNRLGSSRKTRSHSLRLNRSRHHKITFELRGVNVDFVAFPPGSGETQSSVDVRIKDLEIFDHIPTSTWKKFATYMQDAGERETGASMIHIEILNVKPFPDLAASEIVLKATVLPLRLHVDQDALDFITRFFEFKDDAGAQRETPKEEPFLQRVEVNSVKVKLDFKPKRVDYAGLRSGHTTEFMNFLILEEADMVLRHTIIYGIAGFEKMGKCLNDIWMPDIKRNQLPGILAGLAPVRSLVNVGGGFRHLIVVPLREYKKDGRIVRSISKGASAFAKITGTEVVKLGAKVAIGVQTVLQGVEGYLGSPIESSNVPAETVEVEEENKHISPYANQPIGVLQGLRGGYNGLQRDLILARDAIIAVPGEVMEGGTAAGAFQAVRKHAPTVILRPAIGIAKAGGQILMGATNALDPVNLQRAEAKYKKH